MNVNASQTEVITSEAAGRAALAKHYKGSVVSISTPQQDRTQHFDCIVERNGMKMTVDIKDKDEGLGEYFWVETVNYNGDLGWVYGSADRIMFRVEDGWLLCPRKRLILMIEQARLRMRMTVVQTKKYLTNYWETYQRGKDAIVKVPYRDIERESIKIKDAETENSDGLG